MDTAAALSSLRVSAPPATITSPGTACRPAPAATAEQPAGRAVQALAAGPLQGGCRLAASGALEGEEVAGLQVEP